MFLLTSDIRPIRITPDFVSSAAGSCLIECGGTRVICTASVSESVPPFLLGKGRGWVTAEYAMLPASTGSRKSRDGIKKDGRGVEIQRIIGRALRQAVDMTLLGERTITLDCDVLEADGGTRTASITGAFVALVCAINNLIQKGVMTTNPIVHQIAAISVGIVNDEPCLDLCYKQDSNAQADMNLVMNEDSAFIEIQGTGEKRPYTKSELAELLTLGAMGINKLQFAQRKALSGRGANLLPKPRIVIASANRHKVHELSKILSDQYKFLSLNDVDFTDEIDENGSTFSENAIIKAETVMKFTGLPVISDDSGLEVEALGGEPGILSARYALEHGNDEANNTLLLKKMNGIDNRNCRFVCSIALAIPGEKTVTVEGYCNGKLLSERVGLNGFGYDPLFQIADGRSLSELSEDEKNSISHRGNAVQLIQPILDDIFLA